MSKVISIGNIEVPLVDYAVGASAVLGIRDSGKTVTSKGIAEQLLDNGVPIVVFDAVGKWRWMKVAGEKNGKAYKVVVAGGREPDLPLTPHSVPEIVRAALKERIPLIIDLYSKELSKADWRRIVQKAIHIIHYENESGAVHVFLEEAAEFVPQKVQDGETYAEVEKLVRMGGNASVGITLINQRSQEVNKAVLDNCSTALILGCQVGDRAIQAVSSWVEKLDSGTAKKVTESLPRLKSGQAWVWTRKNLVEPSLEQMPMCRSFHPDRRTPADVLVQVKRTDIAEFVSKMAESIPKVIEEAKENDPAELKRKLSETERKLRLAEQKAPEVQRSEPIKVPVVTKEDEHKIAYAMERVQEVKNFVASAISGVADDLGTILDKIRGLQNNHQNQGTGRNAENVSKSRPAMTAVKQSAEGQSRPTSNGTLSGPQRAILQTCALLELRGVRPDVQSVAAWLDLHPNGGSYRGNLKHLHEFGYLDDFRVNAERANDHIQSFATGIAAAKAVLTGPQQAIVEALEQDKSHTVETLAEALNLHPNGGSYRGNLKRLRTMGLLSGGQKLSLSEAIYK